MRGIVASLNPQTTQRTYVCRSGRSAWAGLSTLPDSRLAQVDSVETRTARPAVLAQPSLDIRAFLAHRRCGSRKVRPELVTTVLKNMFSLDDISRNTNLISELEEDVAVEALSASTTET